MHRYAALLSTFLIQAFFFDADVTTLSFDSVMTNVFIGAAVANIVLFPVQYVQALLLDAHTVHICACRDDACSVYFLSFCLSDALLIAGDIEQWLHLLMPNVYLIYFFSFLATGTSCLS